MFDGSGYAGTVNAEYLVLCRRFHNSFVVLCALRGFAVLIFSHQVMEGLTATRIIRAIEQSMSQAGDQIIPLHIVAVSVNSIESKPLCLAAGMQVWIDGICQCVYRPNSDCVFIIRLQYRMHYLLAGLH